MTTLAAYLLLAACLLAALGAPLAALVVLGVAFYLAGHDQWQRAAYRKACYARAGGRS